MSEQSTEIVEGELVPVSTRATMLAPQTDNWLAIYNGDAKTLAVDLASTDFVPKGFRGNPHAVLAAILFGREVGLSPIAALQSLYSVDGRVGTYADMQRALVLSAGHEYRIVEQNASRCVIEGRRKDQDEWQRFSFTIQEARDAGLTSKSNWKNYAPDMLLARATARMCRAIFPDAVHGMSTAEELEDIAAPAATVQQVDVHTGQVVSEQATPRKVTRKRRRTEEPSGPEPERVHAPLPTPQGAASEPSRPVENHAPAAPQEPSEAQLIESTPEPPAGSGVIGLIAQHFSRLGVDDRAERLMWTGLIAGIPQLASSKDMNKAEAATVMKTLERMRSHDALEAWGKEHADGGQS